MSDHPHARWDDAVARLRAAVTRAIDPILEEDLGMEAAHYVLVDTACTLRTTLLKAGKKQPNPDLFGTPDGWR